MPFFTVEENRIADDIRSADLTFYLHTSAPTDAAPTNGRTTVGGGGYENGIVIAASDISVAAFGDIDVDVDIDFDEADEAVGTVTHLSAYRSDRARWLLGYRGYGHRERRQLQDQSQHPALLGQQHLDYDSRYHSPARSR